MKAAPALLLAAIGAGCRASPPALMKVAQYGYEVVHTYPHDPAAFTEGLLYHDGFLYEATGLWEQSSVRKVRLETGEVVQRRELPGQYFGEGIVVWRQRLLQLTYQSGIGFVYDLATFAQRGEFHYPGEGWALTTDGKRILMSDGTAKLRWLNPETLAEQGRLLVTDEGRPVLKLNELEWVKGEIFANVWHEERIARIDPRSGRVKGWIGMGGLGEKGDPENVLNGIAYDAARDRLFVTGKRWSKVFEIRVVKRD